MRLEHTNVQSVALTFWPKSIDVKYNIYRLEKLEILSIESTLIQFFSSMNHSYNMDIHNSSEKTVPICTFELLQTQNRAEHTMRLKLRA